MIKYKYIKTISAALISAMLITGCSAHNSGSTTNDSSHGVLASSTDTSAAAEKIPMETHRITRQMKAQAQPPTAHLPQPPYPMPHPLIHRICSRIVTRKSAMTRAQV